MVQFDTQMFMGINLILGLVLTVFAFKLSASTKTCNNEKVTNSVKGLMVIGVVLITQASTMLACGCGKTSTGIFGIKLAYLFSILSLALGVAIITLSAIIKNGMSDSCKATSSDTGVLIALGSIMSALSVGFLGYKLFQKRGGAALLNFNF